jgi:hypothetical protein
MLFKGKIESTIKDRAETLLVWRYTNANNRVESTKTPQRDFWDSLVTLG